MRSGLFLLLTGVFAAAAVPLRQIPPPPMPAELRVAEGFKVELVYQVPRDTEGSWIALTVDDRGRLIASDQYGGLYRVTPSAVGSSPAVERLGAGAPDVVGAHGLLHTAGGLYVMVNEDRARAGLWRWRARAGADRYDEFQRLLPLVGSGGHGLHAIVPSPDGRSLFLANGNSSVLPEMLAAQRPVAWGEDLALPRLWDPRGIARNRLAPGGYIVRTDLDGGAPELVAIGLRNHYDVAFDANGELFTFDSDNEPDFGLPWYVPTRILHVTSGADFGWRSGAGRWASYFADSLPAAVDTGPGSPTGLIFGTGAKFPAAYQRALFAADWTYGTLYAVTLTPDGASYRGEKKEFLSGRPLPLTDLVVNPVDGALYFCVGGWRVQSALYRVRYVGPETTVPAAPLPLTTEALQRRELETLHRAGVGPETVAQAWAHLGSSDRFLRHAARVALEHQPPERWAERALAEREPRAAIESLLALARVGGPAWRDRLYGALRAIPFRTLPADQRLPWIRVWQVAGARLGRPEGNAARAALAALEPLFPDADPFVTRELAATLVTLDSAAIVPAAVAQMRLAEPPVAHLDAATESLVARNPLYASALQAAATSRPDLQQIALAYALREARRGWTPELRREFFTWFARANGWRGGASLPGFLKNIRADALAHCTADADERARLEALSRPDPAVLALGTPVAPKGPGRDYTVDAAVAAVEGRGRGRDYARGKGMFAASACTACHRFNGEGVGLGPEIGGAGNRYTVRDLLESIIEPSKVINDQYESEQIDLRTGGPVFGRVVGEQDAVLLVMSNLFAPDDLQRVPVADVVRRKPNPLSAMPPGLVNALNEDELADLVAYILSAGDPRDARFRP
jgi:putative heme-binding domain-containing protein